MPHPDATTARRNRSPRRWIVATLLAGVLVTAASVGVAVGAGDLEQGAAITEPNPPSIRPYEEPLGQAFSPAAKAAFGILRRDRVAFDAVPPMTGRLVLKSTFGVKIWGLNPDLARRAKTQVGAAWIAPGNGLTCFVIDPYGIPDGAASAASSSCGPDDILTSGKMVMSYHYLAKKPAHEFIAGLVPDGVEAVTAQLSDGTTQTLTVRDNVYTGEWDGVTAGPLTFTDPTSGDAVVVHP